MSSGEVQRARVNMLLQTLSLKIDYRHCHLIRPSRARNETPVLADALVYIEVLKHSHFSSLSSHQLSYRSIAERLRRVMGCPPSGSGGVAGESPREKYLLIKSVMEYIDYLVRQEATSKVSMTKDFRTVAAVTDDAPVSPHDVAVAQERSKSSDYPDVHSPRELDLHQALEKIEMWADDWLSGHLEGDGDWISFENCLDREA